MEADSGVLNGPSNLHGVYVGKGLWRGERGEAITEGSNEKGREDAAAAVPAVSDVVISLARVGWFCFWLGHGGDGRMGWSEEAEWPQARKM
jgi:hypothetical protein